LGGYLRFEGIDMRDTTEALMRHYVDQLNLSGRLLEIGAQQLGRSPIEEFPEPRFAYHSLALEASDIPNAITADITDCRDTIPDESFDLVMSSDVLPHIDRPWLAASEIGRILKPGGLAIIHSPFGQGDHPGSVDHWRYSPESLELFFGDLECLEKGYDLSEEEQWGVYLVGRKGSGRRVPPFQDSDHPLAGYLRHDTQSVIGDPGLAKTDSSPPPDPLEALRPVLAEITGRLVTLEKLVADRIGQLDAINSRSRRLERRISQLDAIDARSRRLERRIDRAVASFPLRTVLRVRRALHRMLK
jgi:SAM-dependent methyltransferase